MKNLKVSIVLYVVCLAVFVPFLSYGQGIQFEKNLTWQQIKEKAKKENKFIFVDVYATWCGPCKDMDQKVYTQSNVGDLMNEKFINVKVQIDTSKNDDDQVKSWYQDAHKIRKQYQISSLPTLLFFSPDGELVHKRTGERDAGSFLLIAADAMNPEKQYYTLIKKFKENQLAYAQMGNLAIASKNLGDLSIEKDIVRSYENNYMLKLPKDSLFTMPNLVFIDQMMSDSKGNDFKFFNDNIKQIDLVTGKGAAERRIISMVGIDYVKPLEAGAQTNWDDLEKSAEDKFGFLGKISVRQERIAYFAGIRDWEGFGKAYQLYFALADEDICPWNVNDLTWHVFQLVNDQSVLLSAVGLMEKLKERDQYSMDTYANLLYKTGAKDKALEWEKKATALEMSRATKDNDKPDASFQSNVDKMENGQKTW